jgi:PAS domain S-box-containing protein
MQQTPAEEVARSELRYRRLFEAAKDGILIVDPATGYIIDVNPFLIELLGYSHQEYLGKALWEIGPFKDTTLSASRFHELQATGYIRYDDLPLRAKGGRRIEVEFVSNVYQEAGELVIQCNIRDITLRKRGERALRTLSAANEAMVHATNEPALYNEMCRIAVEIGGYAGAWIGLADHDGSTTVRPVAWAGNDLATYLEIANITWVDGERGQGPAGTASRTGEAQVNQNFATNPHVALWRTEALKRGFAASAGLPLKDTLGSPFGVLAIFAAEPDAFDSEELAQLKDLAADLSFGVSVLRDHSERVNSEAQLRQAQKMEAIGNLTGGIAHDFNNMLGVIIGNLDLAIQHLGPDKELSELVHEALEAALRGADLTRRLLAFARLQPLAPAMIEVNSLITDTVRLLHPLLGEHIEITLQLAQKIWPVMADRAQLEASLANLATNARDAMPNGGQLKIVTANRHLDADYAHTHIDVTPGDYAMIEISDTGNGMSPEIMAQIFEPFFTTKEPDKGTGLGLSMVFGFMRQSSGHVSVHSEPGVGTSFRLYLPRSQAVAAPEAAPGIMAGRATGECVLVVEDQPAMRRITVHQLCDLGYRVLEADCAAAALEVLQREPVDLLFSDIVMPGGMDGVGLARLAIAHWPVLKIVLTSGFSDVRAKHDKALLDSFWLLRKPYSKQDLAHMLREALDGAKDSAETAPLVIRRLAAG